MSPKIDSFISNLSTDSIPMDRRKNLHVLIDCISVQLNNQKSIKLNFICTHNSRRSQFAQIWAQAIASFFNVSIKSYSGGIEVTEFNKNAIHALENTGFEIAYKKATNPHYFVRFSEEKAPLEMFSKIYDDPFNKDNGFIAIMTCSQADTNCPLISGAEQRISLTYEDPKIFDGTNLQIMKYLETSKVIATELKYVFLKLSSQQCQQQTEN